MKLILALVSLVLAAGCGQRSGGDTVGQAAGTTSDMRGQGSTSSNPGALDSNGMARDTAGNTGGAVNAGAALPATTGASVDQSTLSGTTQGAGSAAPVDPQTGRDDSTAQKNETIKQSSSTAVQKKMKATRPGTEHDLTGGNDTEAKSK